MKNEKFGFVSAILYNFSPSSIFFSAMYTEALFTFMTLSAIYLFFKKLDKR